jgi:CubicO group peptidase (beta-lactamase class C family)
MTRASGLSKARLGRVHDVLARHVERGAPPGLVGAIARRGETHVDAVGQTAIDGGAPVRRDSIFRIASMSKPVTAVATLILAEECRLRLDDPVDGLLPELADRQVLTRLDGPLDDTVPAERPITVRDLLTFQAGWGILMVPFGTYPIQQAMDDLALAQGAPSPAGTPAPDEWIRRLGTLPLMNQPGATWMYHTGSDILGVLIARAAGQSFETFLRERIFEPLGMVDTGFSVPADKIDRLVTGYWTDPATGNLNLADEPVGGQWSTPPAFPSGGGGLVSTVDDYLAFAQMLLATGQHGGERILSRPSVELMTADHLTAAHRAATDFMPAYWDVHGWGFGVAVVTRRHDVTSVGTYGWDGGLGTTWRNDPHEEMITILLTQAAFTSPVPPAVCADFWASAYQAIDD